MKKLILFLSLLPLITRTVPAGDAQIQECLLHACTNSSNVVVGTIQSVQEIMNYVDDRNEARVLYGAVVGVEGHLWGDGSSRILVLLRLDRDPPHGWGPVFRVPEKDQRFLLFLTPLGIPGTTNAQWRLPCFVPAGLYVVSAICERSASDFSGYSWVLEDLVRKEVVEEQRSKGMNAVAELTSERRLAKAVAVFIEKGLDPGTMTNLAQAVRQIKLSAAKATLVQSTPPLGVATNTPAGQVPVRP